MGAVVAVLLFYDAHLVGFALNRGTGRLSLFALDATLEDGSHDVLDVCVHISKGTKLGET
jgi:hypothetical protein